MFDVRFLAGSDLDNEPLIRFALARLLLAKRSVVVLSAAPMSPAAHTFSVMVEAKSVSALAGAPGDFRDFTEAPTLATQTTLAGATSL